MYTAYRATSLQHPLYSGERFLCRLELLCVGGVLGVALLQQKKHRCSSNPGGDDCVS